MVIECAILPHFVYLIETPAPLVEIAEHLLIA